MSESAWREPADLEARREAPAESTITKRRYRRYSAREKYEAVRYADWCGNDAQAERELELGNGCIHTWRRQGFDSTLKGAGAQHVSTTVEATQFVSASDLQATVWEVIWKDRFPAAALTVIAGQPGLGKSTLEASIAADLTNEGMTGIISNLEDDAEAVTLPRLLAAGAKMDRVLLVRTEVSPRLPEEFDRLAQLVHDTGARFAILDPIAAHFSPERRVHDRAILSKLMSLAREAPCAIIGIHHTTKVRNVNMSAIEAIGGPQGGLSGAARAVYLYGHDPKDEDRRALACVKLNGRDRPATLIVEHETVEVSAGELLLDAGHLRFIEETNADAEEVLTRGARNRNRDAECAEWLTLFLAKADGCSRQSKEVREQGMKVGFGWQTLLRAGVELKIEKGHIGGKGGFWYWRLPDNHPMRKAATRGTTVTSTDGHEDE